MTLHQSNTVSTWANHSTSFPRRGSYGVAVPAVPLTITDCCLQVCRKLAYHTFWAFPRQCWNNLSVVVHWTSRHTRDLYSVRFPSRCDFRLVDLFLDVQLLVHHLVVTDIDETPQTTRLEPGSILPCCQRAKQQRSLTRSKTSASLVLICRDVFDVILSISKMAELFLVELCLQWSWQWSLKSNVVSFHASRCAIPEGRPNAGWPSLQYTDDLPATIRAMAASTVGPLRDEQSLGIIRHRAWSKTRCSRILAEEDQGVGWHVGDESSPSLCYVFFHDGLKWCWHNAIPVECSECQTGDKRGQTTGVTMTLIIVATSALLRNGQDPVPTLVNPWYTWQLHIRRWIVLLIFLRREIKLTIQRLNCRFQKIIN